MFKPCDFLSIPTSYLQYLFRPAEHRCPGEHRGQKPGKSLEKQCKHKFTELPSWATYNNHGSQKKPKVCKKTVRTCTGYGG